MKIRQWLGYNEDASQYLLRPGELRVLNNLQSRRPGMLIARKGLTKIYGKYDNESIFGLYRRATPLGSPSDFLWLQKARVLKELDIGQMDAKEDPYKYVWNVRRIDEYQSRIIDTFDLSTVTNFSVAEDRHGRIFLFYGHGVRPRLYRPQNLANLALPMGLDPPKSAPSVAAQGSGYFIEGVDVQSGGGSYYEPPELTITGGDPTRPAKLKAIVQSGNVVGVEILDGGAGYKTPPTVTASLDAIGIGFRARGVIGNGARQIVGFDDDTIASVTNAGNAPTSTQTFGTSNGVDSNEILYRDSAGNIASVAAEYDSTARRFTALVPVNSTSTTGKGAKARLEFSPLPQGFGLNTNSSQCVTITNSNFMTYRRWIYSSGTSRTRATTYSPYLYGDLWEGSDYDMKGSAENSLYGGLQASGSRFRLGYSGSVNGKQADVYWPDYSQISVWFCIGKYGSDVREWTRADVSVGANNQLIVTLRPSKKAKSVTRLRRSTVVTQYGDYQQLPGATAPVVRFSLASCPDTWLNNSDQCFPTSVKEERQSRLAWVGSDIARPLVGLAPIGQAITTAAVTIDNPGSGWEKDTIFAVRFYQANPYSQFVNYNTATSSEYITRGHSPYQTGTQYIDFVFTANTPDVNTLHGPPQTLINASSVIGIPGDGYGVGDTATVTLCKRNLTQATSAAVNAQTLTWSAAALDTLTASSAGSITSISILNQGRNYFARPTIEVRGGGAGYGLAVEPTITNGRITAVQILDPGLGYTINPELTTSSRAAQLTPVMRPQLRGTYRCAYRYVDQSETVVKTVTATLGNSSTSLILSDATGVEPDMYLEASALPRNSRIKSVNSNQVEINQEITGLAAGTSITVLVRDLTKPISYSDLSPIADVDAGPNAERDHSAEIKWLIPGAVPPARADKVELWRTSADQSLVFYRVEAYGIPSSNGIEIVGTDTLTDEELFDPERPHYAAMPVVLPNGGVNAYRFGTPRSDMSVGVAFQDRLWMGVSTSGEGANTLYYSEFDEFESLPTVNELPIQNNQKSTDVLTAIVPFGAMLLAMQNSHTYAVQYNTDPAIDASIQMMSHRGCLHQRCWDIHENVLYAADESGIYSMARNGEVQDISLPIRDFFVSELLDFSKRETFFLQADPRTHILRFFCSLKSNATDTPSIAMCYDIQAKSWWTESYPNSITSACTGRPGDARINTVLLGAVDGNLYEITGDSDHANDCLTDTFVAEGGSGYREAPEVTAPNVDGAVVRGVVSEGRLVDVIIQHAGWSARGGIEIATESGLLITSHDERPLAGVEYSPIKLNIGPPEPGGVQAVAYANFSVTPRVVRGCTVSAGESFVRLDPARTAQLTPETNPPIAAETGVVLLTQEFRKTVTATRAQSDRVLTLSNVSGIGVGMLIESPSFIPPNTQIIGISGSSVTVDRSITALTQGQSASAVVSDILRPITTEPPPVEIGMEAIGDFIPLNAFVSRIDGRDIYLQHPDGTPALITHGDPRTNQEGTSTTYLENGGTVMDATFRKPYRTHIPFRMATGFMQLVNDENARGGDALIDRSVTVVYTPTPGDKDVEIIERFNGREDMRANIMRRNRNGSGGFVHRQDSASTVLNTSKEASHLGFATGVAKAKFASRAHADMGGEDQHLQVELYARPEQASRWQRTNYWIPDFSIKEAQQFVLHSMEVNGVIEDAQ